jgi:hypothetical protein
MEAVARSELQAVAKRLGQNDPAGFVQGELGCHIPIIKWEKPIVNVIRAWQAESAGPWQMSIETKTWGEKGPARVQMRRACAKMSGGVGKT